MNKEKRARYIYGIMGISLIALCLMLNYLYRPYAYSHHLNDLHLADCYSSFLGVPIVVCFTQILQIKNNNGAIPQNILFAVLMLIGMELIDGILAKLIDWVDIMACILGGIVMYALYLIFGFKSAKEYKE